MPSLPALPALAALPQSESLCPESLSLSLPLPLGETREREEEACEEYDHRWRGALAPHVGAGAGAGAGSGGAGAGEITNTPSTHAHNSSAPHRLRLRLRSREKRRARGVQGEWVQEGKGAPPPAPASTATRAGGGASLCTALAPLSELRLHGSMRTRVGAREGQGREAPFLLGRGTEEKKVKTAGTRDQRRQRHVLVRVAVGDGTHLSRVLLLFPLRGGDVGGTPCVSAGKRLCICGEEEEGEGAPNGAYAVQSPLQGMLSASVGRSVFGGARVLERDKTGAGARRRRRRVRASEYEWEWECELTIGSGGGARVGMGMLARTAGVRRTEALLVEAIETEGGIIADSRRSARDEGRAADMGNDSREGEAGKDGGSGGAKVMKLPASPPWASWAARSTRCSPSATWFPPTRSSRSAEGAGTGAGTRSQSPSTVVVRPSWRYMDVVRRVEWKVAGADSAKARMSPLYTETATFQLGLEDDLNAFISSIVFRKTFEQSKAVDNM
ncbi:hypothetical protein B0H14DRAFT_2650810 [Mycena olivaceomarginata]|nr:hypothetical protein B0H14DRAFT_2650810 [Mycena olivaceomarginata]